VRFESVVAQVMAMSPLQRLVVALSVLAATAAFVGVFRLATQPGMALLYSGLDPAAAGEVVQALEQEGAIFEVRGGAIFVETGRRDSLRMTLAAEGKPSNGPGGYELLDSLSGFGTTSQMFDAAYWRAKEGELARTIASSPLVRSARVHIANANARPFARNMRQSASVMILPSGDGIPTEQAQAFRFLVASAISGLEPGDVSVIDARTARVIDGDAVGGNGGMDQLALALRRRAERLLEAHVGIGNAVVEVSVEAITDSEQIVERRVDPDSRVLISTEVEERASASTNSRPGDVTVASNVPDGDAGVNAGGSTSDNTETRERSNYDVSETKREVLRTPGGIQRITVAVLVNEPPTDDEATVSPRRTEQELADLRDLVASAVGINADRGDVITIRALPFSVAATTEFAGTGIFDMLLAGLDLMKLIQLGVLAMVAIVLGLFVVRPILSRAPPPLSDLRRLPPGGASDGGQPSGEARGLPAPSGEAGPLIRGAPDATQQLVRAVGARQSDAVDVLRGWMREQEGRA
jgi:flagellar M-ring protein FliF